MFKKTIMTVVNIFLLASLISCSSSDKVNANKVVNSCKSAALEDLNFINEGMRDSRYTISSGQIYKLASSEILTIQEIFPSYTSPILIAAKIQSTGRSPVIGFWAIQKEFSGWGATALDKQTKKYSRYGSDALTGAALERFESLVGKILIKSQGENCLKSKIKTQSFVKQKDGKEYANISSLKADFVASGGHCKVWTDEGEIGGIFTGECDGITNLSFYQNSLHAMKDAIATAETFKSLGWDYDFLVGPNWIISGDQVKKVSRELGGTLLIL
jgi:hypothetical protein